HFRRNVSRHCSSLRVVRFRGPHLRTLRRRATSAGVLDTLGAPEADYKTHRAARSGFSVASIYERIWSRSYISSLLLLRSTTLLPILPCSFLMGALLRKRRNDSRRAIQF